MFLIGPSWGRETRVSRATIRLIVVVLSRLQVFRRRTVRRRTVHHKKKCEFRLGLIELGSVRFFFSIFTTNCPTSKNSRAVFLQSGRFSALNRNFQPKIDTFKLVIAILKYFDKDSSISYQGKRDIF